MKCRSLLLVACMLVVPMLAMFSHKIPAEVRAAVRRNLRDSMAEWLGRPAEAGGPVQPVAVARAADAPERVDFVPRATVAPGVADGPKADLRPVSEPAADPMTPPPLVAQLADRSRQARDQQSIESRLKELGAVSFDCQPLPGNEGLHSSSCRVPVDASGQLQRVFQATGADPSMATENLLQQVAAWRQRAAGQAPAAVTAGATDAAPPTRFR